MAIYTTIVCNALSLCVLAIDVTAFFMVVSIVMLMKDVLWLRPFHQAGGALVNGYIGLVDHWWARFYLRSLSTQGKHIIGLLILEVLRLILVRIIGLL